MHNLKLLLSTSWCPEEESKSFCSFVSLSVMEEMDEKFILMTRGDRIIRYSTSSESSLVLDLGREYPLSEDEQLVAVQAVFDQIIIITSHRAFSCTADFQQFECLREFPVAVVLAVWSPNLDFVAIVTADDRMMLASGSDLFDRGDPEGFDMVPEHFGRAQLVNVGWGKKETQFHGTEGKSAATRKIELASGCSRFDSGGIGLTWQSDSEMFAVSSVDTHLGRRVIRMWTADGELHATGEAVSLTSPAPEGHIMAWRGSSNRVAVAARRPQPGSPPQVVFYERNGLQHRQMGCEFVAEVDCPGNWRIASLAWNSIVDVLAVGLQELKDDEGNQEEGKVMISRIQLWTTKNRHWYRKYDISFADDQVVALSWDHTDAYRLHVMTEKGCYRSMEWSWTVSRSVGADSQSFVGVIDGRRLRLSPYLGLCIPPPMAAFIMKFSAPILQLSLSNHSRNIEIALHLADGCLQVVSMGNSDDGDKEFDCGVELETNISPSGLRPVSVRQLLPPGSIPSTGTHLTWTQNGLVVADGKELLNFSAETPQSKLEICRWPSPSECLTYGLCSSSGQLFLQDSNGSVWRKEDEGWKSVTQFAAHCDEWMMVREGFCVGFQSSMNRLMMNATVLMTNCTSFVVHDRGDFVLTSTTDNRLVCIPLGRCKNVDDVVREVRLTAPASNNLNGVTLHNELVRAVERGSVIVVSVGKEAKVVLQMPRGNLEAIFPRALVLDTVRRFIDDCDYRLAYHLMRRHRVNMNLLFDHNLRRFLDDPKPLIQAIHSPDDINMVLAELCDEDLRTTLYKSHYGEINDEKVDNKVNTICERFETILTSSLEKYLSCIVTCYAKRKPQQLSKALQLILSEKERGEIGQAAIQKAMRTLSYYVSTIDLYRLALGTYDFDAVLFVLHNSSLDPREHLPFLEELKNFAEDYRKFRIDVYNENFVKAISHILPSRESSHFEEAFLLIKQHGLFAHALQLYPLDQTHSDEYKTISRAFADQLRQEQRISGLDAAGQVLLRCGEAREAARCFLGTANWRKWATAMTMADMEAEEVKTEAKTLSATLSARGEWEAAVHVLERYALDAEAAVNAAVSGSLWDTALTLTHTHSLSPLLETTVRPALISAADEVAGRMLTVKEEFLERMGRLEMVRANYARSAMEELHRNQWEDDGHGGGVGSDLYSETSSIPESTTSSTASYGSRSSRTSKSRRKAERKKWNLKEGSEYEEVAIIERLYQLGEQANRLKTEIVSLCNSLVDFSLVDTAYRLTKQCGDLITGMRKRRDDIWWETAKKKEGDFERLTTEESLRLLRGESAAMKRQYPDIHEAFLRFPPVLESPPLPNSLMCPTLE